MKNLLDIDQSTFSTNFPDRPFLVRHRLAGHPLLTLPRLIELARNLPKAQVEFNAGDVPVSLDPKLTPYTGLSAAETAELIQKCNSWMVLKHVEKDPEYAGLLNRCLDEIGVFSDPIVAGMFQREGFIFLSSPGSITPYHMDHEHNFLFQVGGKKTVYLFEASDRAVISEKEIETFFGGGHRNLIFKDEYQEKAARFDLVPGLGLHFPPIAPHWVRNGDDVSISFSVTFRSPPLEHRSTVYRVNAHLRNLGFNPTPYGRSMFKDVVKTRSVRLLGNAKRLFYTGRT